MKRTAYTKQLIKDAFIKRVGVSSYAQMTVSALCKEAHVQRSTFYNHYHNVSDVLYDIVDEAIDQIELHRPIQHWKEAFEVFEGAKTVSSIADVDPFLPVCQQIAPDPKIATLLKDGTLLSLIMDRIYERERDSVVPFLKEEMGLTLFEAEKFFIFVLYGALYVNRSMGFKKDMHWYQFQAKLFTFMVKGFGKARE